MAISIGCACGDGNGNTGTPSCAPQFELAIGLGTQETINAAGTKNELDISTAIGTTFLDFFTSSDTSTRIYPISGLQNVDFPQEETQYDTDNTNQKTFLRDGVLSFSADKKDGNHVFAAKLNQGRCSSNSEWIFTKEGVVGIRKSNFATGAYTLSGVPVDAFNAQWMPRKGDAVGRTLITFDFEATVNTGELWMIKYEDLGMTLAQFKLAGLQDVNYASTTVPVVAATDSFDSTLITDYGDGVVSAQNVDGQLIGDFVATNRTSGAAITITSVTEVAQSKYTFVYPNQPTTNVVRMAMVTASGFDGYVDVTTP